MDAMDRRIEASTTIPAAQARVREILIEDPGSVLGDRVTAEQRREREFPLDLAVDVGGGTSLHQAVLLHVGAPTSVKDGLALPVRWKAIGRERLFPTFRGELRLGTARTGTLLQLTGSYTVPLGTFGRFGDGIAGRRVARRTLGALTEQIARRLDTEVARRLESVGWHPAPYPIDLREENHSEIYVG